MTDITELHRSHLMVHEAGHMMVDHPQDAGEESSVGTDLSDDDPSAGRACEEVGADVLVHLWATRQASAERAMLGEGLAAAWEAGDTATVLQLTARIGAIPEVSGLHALGASRRLTDLLLATRWIEIRACREEGASWRDIGAALGMTEDVAKEFYRIAITAHDRADDPTYDARRSAAALDDRNSE